MDLYEICISPIDTTIERLYMASYGFVMVGNVPYQKHEIHIRGPYNLLSHSIPMYGPYMSVVSPEKC